MPSLIRRHIVGKDFRKGNVPWNKGKLKEQDPNELRECTACGEKKIVTDFVRGLRGLYRNKCKACKNAKRRNGRISNTRFQKGHDKGVRFQKGHAAWYKLKGFPAPRLGKINETNENRFTSIKYKRWREAVFLRDGKKCIKCSSTSRLAAHHKIAWEMNEELRFEVENGLTLCCSCHAKEEGLGIVIRPE